MSEHNYPVHEACAVFPMMDAKSFAEFKADIAANGQREDIILWRGMVADGRHRLQACLELGIEPQFCEMDPDVDPVSRIISLNLYRRNLSNNQRAVVAAGFANLKPGDNQHARGEVPQNCGTTQKQAAEAMNTSVRAVQLASAVLKGGCDELVELVKSDQLPLTVAESFVRLVPDKSKQRQAAVAGAKSVKLENNKKLRRIKNRELRDQYREKTRQWQEQQAADQAGQSTLDTAVDEPSEANTKAVESAAPAPTNKVDAGGDPDAVALAALKAAKNPCVTIEKWLRQATPDQVSQVWSIVDGLMPDTKGGRK